MLEITEVLRDTAGMLNAAIRVVGADSLFKQDKTLDLWREQVKIAMALIAGAPEPERAQTAAAMNVAGDHLCWIVNEKEAMALPEKEFLESCRRYRNKIAEERGTFIGGFTIAELETELSKAKEALEKMTRSRDVAYMQIINMHDNDILVMRKRLAAVQEAREKLKEWTFSGMNYSEAMNDLFAAIDATKTEEVPSR